MNSTTKKIVFAAMLAALCCVATMIVKIPTPLKGYINMGDCIVLLAGVVLPPLYGFAAAAVGSALADVLSGYVFYAPATFVIKGVMALIAFFVFKLLKKRPGGTPARIISGVIAETEMVLGYFAFEGFVYGFKAAAVNIASNTIQGIAGLVIGIILVKIFDKNKIFD